MVILGVLLSLFSLTPDSSSAAWVALSTISGSLAFVLELGFRSTWNLTVGFE
jgi:hypothetical protein